MYGNKGQPLTYYVIKSCYCIYINTSCMKKEKPLPY